MGDNKEFNKDNKDKKDIKSINTFHNGYRFRSRLEARWAVFFETIGLRYSYEPEGFRSKTGECYLPDFFIPSLDLYCEVKGERSDWRGDVRRMSSFLKKPSDIRGIMILTELPFSSDDHKHFWFPVLYHDTLEKKPAVTWGTFVRDEKNKIQVVFAKTLFNMEPQELKHYQDLCSCDDKKVIRTFGDYSSLYFFNPGDSIAEIEKGFRVARGYRFDDK